MRLALEKLISDGRIHPTRIEDCVEKAKREVEVSIKQAGEKATFETGVHGLHPEIIKLLGKLRFRTSYGQNALKHSIEVAQLAGLLAAVTILLSAPSTSIVIYPTSTKRTYLSRTLGSNKYKHSASGAEIKPKTLIFNSLKIALIKK